MTEQEIQAALERGNLRVLIGGISHMGEPVTHDLLDLEEGEVAALRYVIARAIVNAEDLIIDKIEADTGLRLRRKVPPGNAEAAAGEGEHD